MIEFHKLPNNICLIFFFQHQTDTVSDLQNLSPDQMNSSFDDKLVSLKTYDLQFSTEYLKYLSII